MSTDFKSPAADPAPDCDCTCASSAALPDWVPVGSEHDPKFACRVMAGVVADSALVKHQQPAKRRKLTLEDYAQGVLSADIGVLSRAITLVESNHLLQCDPTFDS